MFYGLLKPTYYNQRMEIQEKGPASHTDLQKARFFILKDTLAMRRLTDDEWADLSSAREFLVNSEVDLTRQDVARSLKD